jgi:hypothetical protein
VGSRCVSQALYNFPPVSRTTPSPTNNTTHTRQIESPEMDSRALLSINHTHGFQRVTASTLLQIPPSSTFREHHHMYLFTGICKTHLIHHRSFFVTEIATTYAFPITIFCISYHMSTFALVSAPSKVTSALCRPLSWDPVVARLIPIPNLRDLV